MNHVIFTEFPSYPRWRKAVDAYLLDAHGVTLADSILSEARIKDEYELDRLGKVFDYRDFAEQTMREYID